MNCEFFRTSPSFIADGGVRFPLKSAPAASNSRATVLGVRPEQFIIDAEYGVSAEIVVVEPTGSQTQLALRIAGQDIVGVFSERITLAPGDTIPIMPVPGLVHLFDDETGRAYN